ncbi:MAG: hypothetical protein IKG23_05850 [Clostridia bacterium]|nr:hypothetical protein [Clostridia bacterium]
MKKIIAIILSLAMLLCAVSAMAEGKVTLGTVSINGVFRLQSALPEGYKLTPLDVTPEQYIALIISDDLTKPAMQLSIAFDEQYSDVERLNDLDDEALTLLEQSFIDPDPDVEITYGETGYGTRVLVAKHDTEDFDYIVFFSIYRGYCVEFVLLPAKEGDRNLNEEQIATSVSFLTELDFIPASAGVTGEQAVAGLSFITNLSDYDPETDTLKAVAMRSIPLPAAQVEQLEVGDTLIDGEFQEVIETIDKSEEGIILINDEIELRKKDEEYHVYENEIEYIEPIAELTVKIPDNLKIIDNIDKETGDPLEEPVTYTVDEFKAMLADENLSPDFATKNVEVKFNVNCEMVSVERFYTPAQ